MSEQYGSRPSAEAQSNSELVKHEVTELTEVSPEVVAAVKEASSMVWEHNIGKPTVMGYIFARRILNPKTGEDTGASAVYEPDGDKFLFALDTIKEQTRSLSIDQELILFIF